MLRKWEEKTIRKTDNHDSGLEPKTNVKVRLLVCFFFDPIIFIV